MIKTKVKNILKNYRNISNINPSGQQNINREKIYDNELKKYIYHLSTNGDGFPCAYFSFENRLPNNNYAIVYKYKFDTTAPGYTNIYNGAYVSFVGRNQWEVVGVNSSTDLKNIFVVPSNTWNTGIFKVSKNNKEWNLYSNSFSSLSLSLGYGSTYTKNLYISDICIYEISDEEYENDSWKPETNIKLIKTKVNNEIKDIEYIKTKSNGTMKKVFDRLPSEYQRVSYLESTGTQWIDTGFNPQVNSIFKYDGQYLNISSGRCGLIVGVPTQRYYCGVVSGNWACGWENNNYNHSISRADTGRHVFRLDKTTFKLDDVIIKNYSDRTNNLNISIYLFGVNDGGYINFRATMRLYGAQLYLNENTISRNFIPCYRKSDNKPGLYDMVTRTFFTNQGTGEFTIGEEI